MDFRKVLVESILGKQRMTKLSPPALNSEASYGSPWYASGKVKPGRAWKEEEMASLAFGELELGSRTFLIVFLALNFSGVASQESASLEHGPHFNVKLQQSTGNTKADSA